MVGWRKSRLQFTRIIVSYFRSMMLSRVKPIIKLIKCLLTSVVSFCLYLSSMCLPLKCPPFPIFMLPPFVKDQNLIFCVTVSYRRYLFCTFICLFGGFHFFVLLWSFINKIYFQWWQPIFFFRKFFILRNLRFLSFHIWLIFVRLLSVVVHIRFYLISVFSVRVCTLHNSTFTYREVEV